MTLKLRPYGAIQICLLLSLLLLLLSFSIGLAITHFIYSSHN